MAMLSRLVPVSSGHVVIVAQDADAASDSQWSGAMQLVRRAIDAEHGDMTRVAGLVLSDGGAPTVSQRNEMKQVLAGRPYRIGVATDIAVVRMVVGIMSWFNSDMKVVAPARIDQWFAHARVRPAEVEKVWSAFGVLDRELGGTRTAAQIHSRMSTQSQPAP